MQNLVRRQHARPLRRRQFLARSVVQLGGLLLFPVIGSAAPSSATITTLSLIDELVDGIEQTFEWTLWLGEASAALRDGEIVPAPGMGVSAFVRLQEEALAKAKAIEIPPDSPPPLLPVIPARLGRDVGRQRLAQAVFAMDEIAVSAKDLREASERLVRAERRVLQQRTQLEYVEQELSIVLKKVPALFVINQIGFAYLSIGAVYLKNTADILDVLAAKVRAVKAQQSRLTVRARDYGSRLLAMLAREQDELKAERDAFQLELDTLMEHKKKVDERETEVADKAARARQLRQRAKSARGEMAIRVEQHSDYQRRRSQFVSSVDSLDKQIAREFRCRKNKTWENCTDPEHEQDKKDYTENKESMTQLRNQTARKVEAMNQAIFDVNGELAELAAIRDAAAELAERMEGEVTSERAAVSADRDQLSQDFAALLQKRHRSRADVFYAESVEQGMAVNEWLQTL